MVSPIETALREQGASFGDKLSVVFDDGNEKRAISWARYNDDTIVFLVPRQFKELSEETSKDIVAVLFGKMTGRTVELMPSTVLELRDRFGYVMPRFDDEGRLVGEGA